MASSRALAAAFWIAIAVSWPISPALAESRGAALFKLCTSCHGPEAAGDQKLRAPSIAGLPQWYVEAQLEKFRSGVRGTHPQDFPGMRMRPMSLVLRTAEDVKEVSGYVAGLSAARPTPSLQDGDRSRGAELFRPCGACHGADGAGNQQLGGPPLRYASDWYLLAQLENFRAGIRGSKPTDTGGALMRPMALTLPDAQALKDVIAHISSLAK